MRTTTTMHFSYMDFDKYDLDEIIPYCLLDDEWTLWRGKRVRMGLIQAQDRRDFGKET